MCLTVRGLMRSLVAGLMLMASVLASTPFADAPPAEAQAGPCPPMSGWSQIADPIDTREYQGNTTSNKTFSVAEDWQTRGRLYVIALCGAYASEDCGATWRQIAGHTPPLYASFDGVAVATDPEGRLFIAGGVNRYLHVRQPTQGTEGHLTIHYGVGTSAIIQRGLSVSAAGRLYVRTGGGLSVRNGDGFHYSDDGGETWTIRRGEGPYVFVADPLDREVVYSIRAQSVHSGPYQFARSVDSGATFQPWSELPERPGAIGVSVDGSRFWFASNDQHLWQSRDGGQSWQIMDTMPFTAPVQLVGSPHDPRVIFAVSEDGHIWAYREPSAAPAQVPAAR